MKIVIVHHLNDAQHYLFGVPEERDLKKDDLVLVRNSRGEVPAVCVCCLLYTSPSPRDRG